MSKAKKQEAFILVDSKHLGAREGRKPFLNVNTLNDLLEKNARARVVLACPDYYNSGILIVIETDRKKGR